MNQLDMVSVINFKGKFLRIFIGIELRINARKLRFSKYPRVSVENNEKPDENLVNIFEGRPEVRRLL